MMPSNMTYEQWFNMQTAKRDVEKSFTDKVLGRQDTDNLQLLIQKDELTRQDFSNILNIMSGINSKLVNYNEFDRYLLGKYFAWIRSFVSNCMGTITVQDTIIKMRTDYSLFCKQFKVLAPVTMKGEVIGHLLTRENELLDKMQSALREIRNNMADDSKFLLDVFLFISNSTMSIGAACFDTLTTSRFEYAYPGGATPYTPQAIQPEAKKGGPFSFMRRR